MFKEKILNFLLSTSFLPAVLGETAESAVAYTYTTEEYIYAIFILIYSYLYYFATTYWMIIVPIIVIPYIYKSLTYMFIAKKLDHKHPWFAWIPLLRGIQKLQLADLSGWLIILSFIPVINIFTGIVLGIMKIVKICKKRGFGKGLWILGLLPIINFVLLGILAWGKSKEERGVKKENKEEKDDSKN